MQLLPATFQHQSALLKHETILSLNVRTVHIQLCISRFRLGNEVLELRERLAQQFVFFILALDGLLTFLLKLSPALISILQVFELKQDTFPMTKHILVYLHALALGSKLFQNALQRFCFPLFFNGYGRKRLYLLLYIIIIVEQESRLCID